MKGRRRIEANIFVSNSSRQQRYVFIEEIGVGVHVVCEQRCARRDDEHVSVGRARVERSTAERSHLLTDVQEDELARRVRDTPCAHRHALVGVVDEHLLRWTTVHIRFGSRRTAGELECSINEMVSSLKILQLFKAHEK